jgi:tetratricopeptide (TPR) repeat protein
MCCFMLQRHAESLAYFQEAQKDRHIVLPQQSRQGTGKEELSSETLVRVLSVAASDPDSDAARTMFGAGRVYHRLGRHSEALAMYEDALRLLSQATGLDGNLNAADSGQAGQAAAEPEVAESESCFGGTCLRIGLLFQRLGRYPYALVFLEAALRARTAVLGPSHADVARLLSRIGAVYREDGRLVESLERHEAALLALRGALSLRRPIP